MKKTLLTKLIEQFGIWKARMEIARMCGLLAITFFTMTSFAGCGDTPFIGDHIVKPSDFVGTYETDLSEYLDNAGGVCALGTERITLLDDGTYKQLYTVGTSISYSSSGNKWHMVRLPNGIVQIQLDNAEYLLCMDGLESGAHVVWDPGAEKYVPLNGGPLVFNTIIHVEEDNNGMFKVVDTALRHLPVGDPDVPTYVVLNRVNITAP
ncbi:MAG: hypothetical protein J5I90_14725 [Caldilineales bacterium]|nr:hypothetical protein [Caldilineales bacterium]